MIYTLIVTVIIQVGSSGSQFQQYEHDYPTKDICNRMYEFKRDSALKAASGITRMVDISVQGICIARDR